MADERTEARAHFKKGMAAIAEGHYDVGIEELKTAYDILPHPNVLYNIARAYVDTGRSRQRRLVLQEVPRRDPKDRDEVALMVTQPRGAHSQAAGDAPRVAAGAGRRGAAAGGPGDARCPRGPAPGALPGGAPGAVPDGPPTAP